MISTVALATSNINKIREFRAHLESCNVELFDGRPLDLPPETGRDYLENALIKARYAAAAWNVPCVAEDSGIEVVGLNNWPGIYSARFSSFDQDTILRAIGGESTRDKTPSGFSFHEPGPENDKANVDLMILLMRGMMGDARCARYVACLAMVSPVGDILYTTEASVCGRILFEPRGKNGFGYDPIMELYDFPGHSVAELNITEKNEVSHRGQAIRNLLAWLERQDQ